MSVLFMCMLFKGWYITAPASCFLYSYCLLLLKFGKTEVVAGL
jgi:hypothetical protein